MFSAIIVALLVVGLSVPAFAESEIEGKPFENSNAEIENLARLNNVDADELRKAFERGPDENGEFHPFANLTPINDKITQEELDFLNSQKRSSTGEPIVRFDSGKDEKISLRGEISRQNQDTTAYNWTGYKTANGNWPVLGIAACHRVKDITPGSTCNAPVIPFNTYVYLDRDVWLPDGVGYTNEFHIDDTGLGPGWSDYWLDIYYHKDVTSAKAYGHIILTYNQMI